MGNGFPQATGVGRLLTTRRHHPSKSKVRGPADLRNSLSLRWHLPCLSHAGDTVTRQVCLLLAVLAMATGAVQAAQQAPAQASETQAAEPSPPEELIDVFDVWRMVRHKEADAPAEAWDYRKPMMAFAPVIGAKPSAGVLLGVAGNVAFYRGDPSATHISSVVASVTFSTKSQTAVTDRFTMFASGDRWRLDGDHRFQWTSQETNELGTSADTREGVRTDFDFFRLHHTAYYRLRPGLFAGAGLYFDNHTNIEPGEDAEADWAESPYVQYSEAHGFPLDSQISAGPSFDLLWDTRDSFINADRGWLAKASYRTLFDGFLGGDSSWQKVNLDLRTYANVSRDGRHRLAFWAFADLVVGGVAPYMDLPATALDTYGRSARGYSEGQFRGEKLAYGEIEYRATLTRNGLLGMVAFLNTTTVTNREDGEDLFDSFATGGGAGVRLLINKRSKTNLCFDVGVRQAGFQGRLSGDPGSLLTASARHPTRVRDTRSFAWPTQGRFFGQRAVHAARTPVQGISEYRRIRRNTRRRRRGATADSDGTARGPSSQSAIRSRPPAPARRSWRRTTSSAACRAACDPTRCRNQAEQRDQRLEHQSAPGGHRGEHAQARRLDERRRIEELGAFRQRLEERCGSRPSDRATARQTPGPHRQTARRSAASP